MKKLLFLTNDMNLQLGGQGLSNIIILDYLKKDFDIKILNQQFFKGTSNYREVQVDYNVDFQKSFLVGFLRLKETFKEREREKFDLIIISANPFSTLVHLFLIELFGFFRKTNKIHFCRIDPISSIFTASRIPFILFPLGFLLYRRLDKIVVQNPQMGDTFEKYYGVDRSKIVLIPNPLRPDYKRLLSDKEKPKIKARKPWITTITRLETKQKDPETLIKAFGLVKEKEKQASLIICGTGDERGKLLDLIEKLGLSNDVHFLGFVKNPFKILKKSDVFVLSSKAEGFGKVMVEAQVARVPVVATDCPVGPKWALGNGKAGTLVKVGDENEMASAILNILNDRKRREKYIKNGLKLVVRHYPEKFYNSLDSLVSPFQ